MTLDLRCNMDFTFPSDAWIRELKKQINASEEYRTSAAEWEAGDLCLVVNADQSVGLKEDYFIWLDLHQGECRKAKHVSPRIGEKAKFLISADLERWKQVLNRDLNPIKGMLQGKLRVKGDLFTVIRYTKAALDLVDCACRIPTTFLDEVV